RAPLRFLELELGGGEGGAGRLRRALALLPVALQLLGLALRRAHLLLQAAEPLLGLSERVVRLECLCRLLLRLCLTRSRQGTEDVEALALERRREPSPGELLPPLLGDRGRP